MKRQNIAGCCLQTFENKNFVDITQQWFALLTQVNFPAKTEVEGDEIESRLSSFNLFYFIFEFSRVLQEFLSY